MSVEFARFFYSLIVLLIKAWWSCDFQGNKVDPILAMILSLTGNLAGGGWVYFVRRESRGVKVKEQHITFYDSTFLSVFLTHPATWKERKMRFSTNTLVSRGSWIFGFRSNQIFLKIQFVYFIFGCFFITWCG